MKNIRVIALLTLLMGPLAACAETPTIYESKPIEGWVIDADTGAPIEGAVVLANWEMWLHGPKAVGDVYDPKIMEAVTDSSGHFVIAGWGPEPVCCGYMTEEDPLIHIFKPGYAGFAISDGHSAVVDDPRVRNPYWNGQKFQLKSYKGNYKGDEGQNDFDTFDRFIFVANFGFLTQRQAPCGWTKVPNFMQAVSQQLDIFKQHGYYDRNSIIKNLLAHEINITESDHCESPKEFFEGLKQ